MSNPITLLLTVLCAITADDVVSTASARDVNSRRV